MLTILSGMVVGGISLYAGLKIRDVFNDKETLGTALYKKGMSFDEALLDSDEDDLMLAATESDIMMIETWIDKDFSIATASLALIIAGQTFFAPLLLGGVAGLVYLVWPTWKRAYYDITQKRRFTRMVLESLVLPGTILVGHFFAAATAYWFLYFALNMVSKAKGRTTQNLADVFVTPMRDGVEVEMTLKDVQVGDILVVEAGEIGSSGICAKHDANSSDETSLSRA